MHHAIILRKYFKQRWGKPTFSMACLSDDPTKGYLVKLICSDRHLDFNHFPQFGMPKIDKEDPVPQFDEQNNTRVTFQLNFIGDMVAVTKNLAKTASEAQRYKKISFAKSEIGYCIHVDSHDPITEEITSRSVVFEGVYAIGLEFFLSACVNHLILQMFSPPNHSICE